MTTLWLAILSFPVINVLAATPSPRSIMSVTIALWITSFLCLLNVAFAIIYRKRRKWEVISYYAICVVELGIFVFLLLWRFGIITRVPFQLPPGLPFNRAEIGAALAIGIGLFPVAYWHRINISELPGRIAKDSTLMKARDGRVHVPPGEWMN